jgi:hypothetical protein
MCGTFMQIIGQSAALYMVDMFIYPAFGGSATVDLALFLIKGMITFYVYKWFQCGTSGVFRHPLQGISFWHALLGGIIGTFTLFITGSLVNERFTDGAINVLFKYGVEAIVLNVVYGMTANMISDAATNALRNYG